MHTTYTLYTNTLKIFMRWTFQFLVECIAYTKGRNTYVAAIIEFAVVACILYLYMWVYFEDNCNDSGIERKKATEISFNGEKKVWNKRVTTMWCEFEFSLTQISGGLWIFTSKPENPHKNSDIYKHIHFSTFGRNSVNHGVEQPFQTLSINMKIIGTEKEKSSILIVLCSKLNCRVNKVRIRQETNHCTIKIST